MSTFNNVTSLCMMISLMFLSQFSHVSLRIAAFEMLSDFESLSLGDKLDESLGGNGRDGFSFPLIYSELLDP